MRNQFTNLPVLLFLFAAACGGATASVETSSPEECAIGDTMVTQDGNANDCTCTEDGWACTGRARVNDGDPTPDSACASGFRQQNGPCISAGTPTQECTLGDRRDDGTNTCTCTADGWACTMIGEVEDGDPVPSADCPSGFSQQNGPCISMGSPTN